MSMSVCATRGLERQSRRFVQTRDETRDEKPTRDWAVGDWNLSAAPPVCSRVSHSCKTPIQIVMPIARQIVPALSRLGFSLLPNDFCLRARVRPVFCV